MYNEPLQTRFVKRDGIIQKYINGNSGTDYTTWQLAKSVHTGSLSSVGGQIKNELHPEVKCRGTDRFFLTPDIILNSTNVKQVNYES